MRVANVAIWLSDRFATADESQTDARYQCRDATKNAAGSKARLRRFNKLKLTQTL